MFAKKTLQYMYEREVGVTVRYSLASADARPYTNDVNVKWQKLTPPVGGRVAPANVLI